MKVLLRIILFTVLCHCGKSKLTKQRRSAGCNSALGLESKRITDSQISAFSYDDDLFKGKWFPYYGRLNNKKAWCSSTNRKGVEYLQIDLGRVRHVMAVATQGIRVNYFTHYYVKKYKIRYSFDGSQWFDYQPDKKYTGNSDGVKINTNYLHSSFVTRFVRLYPYEYSRDMCMRVELYGCPDSQECTNILVADKIPQNVTSPGYPIGYSSNTRCTWIIKSSPTIANGKVSIYFTDLDVGSDDVLSCTNKVEILDGQLHTADSLGVHCNGPNGKQEQLQVLTSSGEYLRIELDTDSGTADGMGFQMTYLTTVQGLNDILSDAQCHGDNVILNCSSHEFNINIINVFYGAYPGSSCDHSSPTSSVKCMSTTALTKVQDKCQHRKSCTLSAIDQNIGSNPCVTDGNAVTPLLKVFYQCTSVNETNVSIILPTMPISMTPLPTTQPNESNRAKQDTPSSGDLTVTLIIIAVVIVTVLVAVSLAVVLLCRRKRSKYSQNVVYHPADSDNYEDVEYDLPNSLTQNKQADDVNKNCLESDNLLYESIDIPARSNDRKCPSDVPPVQDKPAKIKCTSTIYDSCPNLTHTRITENPLYESSVPSASCSNLDRKQNVYDSVIVLPKKESSAVAKHPSLPSISNPNYEETVSTKPPVKVPDTQENELSI